MARESFRKLQLTICQILTFKILRLIKNAHKKTYSFLDNDTNLLSDNALSFAKNP